MCILVLKKSGTSHFFTQFPYLAWPQIGKGVCQGCILSHYLFNLYAKYIVQNAWLDEAQADIKIPRRSINLRYAAEDTNTLLQKEKKN